MDTQTTYRTITAGLDLIEAEVRRALGNLPLARQVRVVRAAFAEHNWSYGVDQIEAGCDILLSDMADAERDAHPDPFFVAPMPIHHIAGVR